MFDAALRYVIGGWWRKLISGDPLFVTVFVTARCPYRCPHCFYRGKFRRTRGKGELGEWEFHRIATGMPAFPRLLIGGGEPTLRPDLAAICRSFITRNRVTQLTLTSNGFRPERLRETVRRLLDLGRLRTLDVQLSLDGIGERHDRIRGQRGAFERVIAAYGLLRRLAEEDPVLHVRFNYTFSALNQDGVEETYRWLREELGVERLGMTLIRGQVVDPAARELDPRRYEAAARLVAAGESRELPGPLERLQRARVALERQHNADVAQGRARPIRCLAGLLTAVIYEQGELAPCEMLPERFGNLRESGYRFAPLWRGPRAREFRERMRTGACSCTFETTSRLNLSFHAPSCLRLLRLALAPQTEEHQGAVP